MDTTVKLVMTPEVLGIVPTASLEVALRTMAEAGVHHLPVVDRDCCIGLLHESDVLWRLWSTAATVSPLVRAVARRPVVVVGPSDDVRTVARSMVDAETDAAVVVDDDGQIVGIVTATDLLRRLAAA
ncbi:HPP family protein [Actinophytocola sp.]|uniref:CBS domain-containing protein n=1 Tax=Actinophytocola sp. TaxID=1872138 RepID=UPI003899A8EB